MLSTAAPRPLPVQVSEEEAAASKAVRRQQAEERQAEITARLAQIEEQLRWWTETASSIDSAVGNQPSCLTHLRATSIFIS